MRFNEADNSTPRASVLSIIFSVLFCYLLDALTYCHENFYYYDQDYIMTYHSSFKSETFKDIAYFNFKKK